MHKDMVVSGWLGKLSGVVQVIAVAMKIVSTPNFWFVVMTSSGVWQATEL